jgi:hypothetical protein
MRSCALGRLFVVSLSQTACAYARHDLVLQIFACLPKNKHATNKAARCALLLIEMATFVNSAPVTPSLHSVAFSTKSSTMTNGPPLSSLALIKAQKRADALRENLKRRKDQSRARRELQAAAPEAGSENGVPTEDERQQPTQDHTRRA